MQTCKPMPATAKSLWLETRMGRSMSSLPRPDRQFSFSSPPPKVRLVQLPLGQRQGRHGVVAGHNLHVALGDLLGVVKRVRVQKGPEKLARDVLERELEMGVLKRGVVAGVVDRPRQRIASFRTPRSLVLRHDPLGRVAGPRGRHHVLERPRERVDEADAGRGRKEREGPLRLRETRHRFVHSSLQLSAFIYQLSAEPESPSG